MHIRQLAVDLLDVATTALPAVDRSFVAGGPAFARTCTLLATYGSLVQVTSQGPAGNNIGAMFVPCAGQPVPQVTLVYAKDCYPMPSGESRRLPDAADLTAWSTDWLNDVQTLHDAVLAAALDTNRFGDCSTVTVDPATFTGPSSGVAVMSLPVTVRGS